MRIYVVRVFTNHAIEVEGADSIGWLMEIIKNKCGVPIKCQTLLFNGHSLVRAYTDTLRFEICEEEVIDNIRIIKIRTFNGEHKYKISPNVPKDIVHKLIQANLEQKYSNEWKLHLTKMINIHATARMKTLKDHNINCEDKIYLQLNIHDRPMYYQ